jgi:adenosylcobinamide-GDP ribazoletransferase
VTFLTIVRWPVSPSRLAETPDLSSGAEWNQATMWFPIVGLMIGAAAFPVMLLPIPPFVRAAIVLALWIGLTGGFHEDGLIDCLDAAFAPVDRTARLAILKDPHVGAVGVTGAIAFFLLRFSVLAAVPPLAVLVAPLVGRWAMVGSLAWAKPARTDGLGWSLSLVAQPRSATLVAGVLLVGLTALSRSPSPLLAWIAGAGAGVAWGGFLSGRFGGLTGDGHGSIGLIAEVGALAAFLPIEG